MTLKKENCKNLFVFQKYMYIINTKFLSKQYLFFWLHLKAMIKVVFEIALDYVYDIQLVNYKMISIEYNDAK